MSLDGFIAGPNAGVALPMGEGGERIDDWMFNSDPDQSGDSPRTPANELDAGLVRDLVATTGAVVMGRRTFDLGEGPWGDTPFPVPCFVITHEARDELVKDSGTFTFVTDGIESALLQAQAAAGENDVCLMGADIAQQCLRARPSRRNAYSRRTGTDRWWPALVRPPGYQTHRVGTDEGHRIALRHASAIPRCEVEVE
jgi:dihydrofolate reductase